MTRSLPVYAEEIGYAAWGVKPGQCTRKKQNIASIVLISITFPLMGAKTFFWPFVVWMFFEGIRKILFRREIPCPHCGFDATWYRKDVKVARQQVQEFWDG